MTFETAERSPDALQTVTVGVVTGTGNPSLRRVRGLGSARLRRHPRPARQELDR